MQISTEKQPISGGNATRLITVKTVKRVTNKVLPGEHKKIYTEVLKKKGVYFTGV